jgi:DoxX-like family
MPDSPLLLIGAGLGATGVANLAGSPLIKREFERFGYPDSIRTVVGAIEVGVAATAVAGLRDTQARRIAALGTLASMTGAIATHRRVGDPAYRMVPALVLTAAALAVLR